MSTELMQMPAFAAALNTLGVATRALPLGDWPDAQMVLRRVPGLGRIGLISRSDAPPEALRNAARRAGQRMVLLNPTFPAPQACRDAGFFPLYTPARRAMLDLTGPAQDRLDALHQKWRNRLRHAQNAPLRVTRHPLPDTRAQWLFRADTAQARTRGYRPLPPQVIEAYALQSPGDVQLFLATQAHTTVAAMLFTLHGDGASYQTGHITAAGRAASAHNLILWQAAEWLSQNGVSTLDLGLIDTENTPGLARFKLGTGAKVASLGGSWVRAPGLSLIARNLPRSLLI
ncbi:GNAT family N-acetyltransferase [Actibacterium mucosum]|nr:GNAT family N-acetyltransferase [Actibacterium mucosum]